MPFVEVPIIGSGTDPDPYRAAVPSGVRHSAHIPSNPDGTPKFATAIVWIPGVLPPGLTAIPRIQARTTITARDLRADMDHMERT